MRPWLRTVLVLALVLAIIGVVGWREAQSDPVVRRAAITLAGGDPTAPPLRLALVSDIHVGNLTMPVSRLDRIVDQINAQHPDAVLLAGDFVNGNGPKSPDFHPELLAAPLSRLHAPLGIFAVMGNHDIETSPARVTDALHRAGITVLRDRVVRVGPIALIGMDMNWYWSGHLGAVLASARHVGGFPVLLTHGPPFALMQPPGMPLVLAGHTHCGQIVAPGWDNSFDPVHWQVRFNPALRCGIGHTRRHLVVVTGGVGGSTIPPIRINAPPDFWMLTLTGAPLRH